MFSPSSDVQRYRALRWRDVNEIPPEDFQELEVLADRIGKQERDSFTRTELGDLLGRDVVAGVDLAGIPRASRGRIVSAYGGADAWHVDVAWDDIPGGSPRELQLGGRRVDGFSRIESLLFLDVQEYAHDALVRNVFLLWISERLSAGGHEPLPVRLTKRGSRPTEDWYEATCGRCGLTVTLDARDVRAGIESVFRATDTPCSPHAPSATAPTTPGGGPPR